MIDGNRMEVRHERPARAIEILTSDQLPAGLRPTGSRAPRAALPALPAYNALIQHTPGAVVEPRVAGDVCAVVRAAAENGRRIEVISTGHGAPPASPESIALTTRHLRGVRVDASRRTATIGAGARWADVVRLTSSMGLMPVVGSSPSVGVVGYTLGGGVGLLGRQLGWSADRVLSIDVVTANGALLKADPDTYPDLFWALRGGGGGLGVVTAMEVELDPVTELVAGGVLFPARYASELFSAYRAWTPGLPEDVGTSLALTRFPLRDAPHGLDGRFVVHLRFVLHGERSRAAEILAPMRRAAPVLHDSVRSRALDELAEVHLDPEGPVPLHEGNVLLPEFSESAAQSLVESAGPDSSSCLRLVELRHLGGAMARAPRHPSAVSHRSASYLLHAVAASDPRVQSGLGDEAKAHVDHVLDRMRPWSIGTARNFRSSMEHELPEDCFDRETLHRLAKVKRAYDPGGIFPSPWPTRGISDPVRAAVRMTAMPHSKGNF